MVDHTYETHTKCRNEGHCNVCDGGLAICTTCGGVEGSLAKECPGFRCEGSHGDAIYEGYIDFEGGVWVLGPSIHSPAYYHALREEENSSLRSSPETA